MTAEQLKIGQKKLEELNKFKNFKKAFNNGYINSVVAVDYCGKEQANQSLPVSVGDELHALINDYVNKEIKKLQKEFEEM